MNGISLRLCEESGLRVGWGWENEKVEKKPSEIKKKYTPSS